MDKGIQQKLSLYQKFLRLLRIKEDSIKAPKSKESSKGATSQEVVSNKDVDPGKVFGDELEATANENAFIGAGNPNQGIATAPDVIVGRASMSADRSAPLEGSMGFKSSGDCLEYTQKPAEEKALGLPKIPGTIGKDASTAICGVGSSNPLAAEDRDREQTEKHANPRADYRNMSGMDQGLRRDSCIIEDSQDLDGAEDLSIGHHSDMRRLDVDGPKNQLDRQDDLNKDVLGSIDEVHVPDSADALQEKLAREDVTKFHLLDNLSIEQGDKVHLESASYKQLNPEISKPKAFLSLVRRHSSE